MEDPRKWMALQDAIKAEDAEGEVLHALQDTCECLSRDEDDDRDCQCSRSYKRLSALAEATEAAGAAWNAQQVNVHRARAAGIRV